MGHILKHESPTKFIVERSRVKNTGWRWGIENMVQVGGNVDRVRL